MSPGPSKQMRDLFAAARGDGPDDATRDALWDRLAVTTGIGAAAAGTGLEAAKVAPSAKAASAAGSAAGHAAASAAGGSTAGAASSAAAVKLVVTGVAVGALSTALGVFAVSSASEPAVAPSPASRVPYQRVVAEGVGRPAGASLAVASARAKAEPASAAPATTLEHAEHAEKHAAEPSAAPAQTDAESALAEEARLLTEARKALVRGAPAEALVLAKGVERLPVRALEPEQMGIQARALRALGRTDEAAAVEIRLRARYPEHALAR